MAAAMLANRAHATPRGIRPAPIRTAKLLSALSKAHSGWTNKITRSWRSGGGSHRHLWVGLFPGPGREGLTRDPELTCVRRWRSGLPERRSEYSPRPRWDWLKARAHSRTSSAGIGSFPAMPERSTPAEGRDARVARLNRFGEGGLRMSVARPPPRVGSRCQLSSGEACPCAARGEWFGKYAGPGLGDLTGRTASFAFSSAQTGFGAVLTAAGFYHIYFHRKNLPDLKDSPGSSSLR